MAKGKQTCKILKEIRKQIAAENDIKLVIEECTYQGDCLGTCPKCEAEVRYLERELEKRQRMGKAAVFAGMSLGTALAAAGCGPFVQPLAGMPADALDSTEMVQDTIIDEFERLAGEPCVPDTTEMAHQNDNTTEELFLLEGDVPMVKQMPDTMSKEGQKTTCKDSIVEREVFGMVPGEQMPAFRGGDRAMFEYMEENLVYPQEAIDAGVEGKVFVRFWINEDGSLSDFEVPRGIGYGCDDEAVRVIQSMPKWMPGKRNHEPVKMQYLLPVVFKLEDEKD